MGLQSVLVDKARPVRKVVNGARVEGTTVASVVTGEWFRARLTLAEAQETTENGRKRTLPAPSLIYSLRDLGGNLIQLAAQDKVEIESVQLGNNTWQVTGDPKPIRKKRSLIGYKASLKRVDEHKVTIP
jgi:hypothetical protein